MKSWGAVLMISELRNDDERNQEKHKGVQKNI